MATTVIGLLADGSKLIKVTAAGPSSYDSSAGQGIVADVDYVDEVISAHAPGYLIDNISVSGNAITVHWYYFDYDATADGAATEVADTTDLSGVTVTIIAIAH